MTMATVIDGAARWHVEHGDSLVVLKAMPDACVDAIVADPPYGLSREPDIAEVLRHWLAGDDYVHTGSGFMGKTWDSFVPGPSIWRECFRVLKPGGHMLAFGGTRTYDMMTIAIRMAGFEVRDTVQWLYGSGFPKSLDVSKAIDKAGVGQITAPSTEAAKRWNGWGTALKPAHEPIILARKPPIGTVAANVLAHGTGALNIDACRIATTDNLNGGAYAENGTERHDGDENWGRSKLPGDEREGAALGMLADGATTGRDFVQPSGRWPANLCLSHSPGCERVGTKTLAEVTLRKETVAAYSCTPDCPVAELDRQSGERPVSGAAKSGVPAVAPNNGMFASRFASGGNGVMHNDTGGASRFFNTFQADEEDLATGEFVYCAKASRADREAGLREAGLREAVADSTYGDGFNTATKVRTAEQSATGDVKREAVRNHHPTVKPHGLMRHLCKLITPPNGVVLDPFFGSGSTGRGALAEGFRVIGIEREAEYVEIARARCAKADSSSVGPCDESHDVEG